MMEIPPFPEIPTAVPTELSAPSAPTAVPTAPTVRTYLLLYQVPATAELLHVLLYVRTEKTAVRTYPLLFYQVRYCCSITRTYQKKYPGIRKKNPGGVIMLHPRKKRPMFLLYEVLLLYYYTGGDDNVTSPEKTAYVSVVRGATTVVLYVSLYVHTEKKTFLPKTCVPGPFGAENRYILKHSKTNHTPGFLRLASITSYLFLA